MVKDAWNLFTKFTFFKKRLTGRGWGPKEIIRTLFSFRNKESSNQMKFHKFCIDLFAKSALRNPRGGLGDDITVP